MFSSLTLKYWILLLYSICLSLWDYKYTVYKVLYQPDTENMCGNGRKKYFPKINRIHNFFSQNSADSSKLHKIRIKTRCSYVHVHETVHYSTTQKRLVAKCIPGVFSGTDTLSGRRNDSAWFIRVWLGHRVENFLRKWQLLIYLHNFTTCYR